MADLNLIKLLPEKFQSDPILLEYFLALGEDDSTILSANKLYNVKNWLDLTTALGNLINPDTVDVSFLRHLAVLINVDLSPEDSTTESVLRSEVTEAVDWYKLKGTYSSLDVISLIVGINFNIWDLYTNDYSTFHQAAWFSGLSENDNPADYPYASGYYKSPHFGVEIELNKVYSPDSSIPVVYDHLWHYSYWVNLKKWIEKTRPVHTVPEYSLLMSPVMDNDGSVNSVAGSIESKTLTTFITGGKTFDQNAAADSDYDGDIADWTFDEDLDSDGDSQTTFDEASQNTLLLIDTYKLGTGSKGIDLDSSDWTGDLEDSSPVEGSIAQSDITDYGDKTEIEINITAATELDGVSELGIYTDGGTSDEELVVVSLFPDIYKGTTEELKILVTINKV